MFISALKWAFISLYTIILGIPAIFLSFFFPGSDIVPWFGKLWTSLILKTAGVTVSVSGHENIQKENVCIYIANHLSYFDVFALVNILPVRTRIVAKRYLFLIPVFGWSIYLAGYISVNMKNRDDIMKSFDDVARKVRRGKPILFFAEGIRSADGKLQDFKKGAFLIALKAGAPVIPITVSGSYEIMPRGTWRIRSGTMNVIIDKPIPTEDLSVSQLNDLMVHVRSTIAENIRRFQNE